MMDLTDPQKRMLQTYDTGRSRGLHDRALEAGVYLDQARDIERHFIEMGIVKPNQREVTRLGASLLARLSPLRRGFSLSTAKDVGDQLEVDWNMFDIDQFRRGMNVELEHGTMSPATNITDNDPIVTGKIALAHLNEIPDYYTRLNRMEKRAKTPQNPKSMRSKIVIPEAPSRKFDFA